MRYPIENEDDKTEAAKLNAEPWMLAALDMNPNYNSWGPYEDCMWKEKKDWEGRLIFDTWKDFGPWDLDDMNEVVNFYFEVNRESTACNSCGQTGYNPETKKLADDWYDFAKTGRQWDNQLTQHEVNALIKANRLKPGATAANVNLHPNQHDAINRSICVQARAERMGVYGLCKTCKGDGYVFTKEKATLGLVLWIIHPRKGASRGAHIKQIRKNQLPAATAFLKEAAARNAERFSKL